MLFCIYQVFYLIKSAMDIIFRFSTSANCRSLGNLAMEPSSSTISQRTAMGSNPAKTARSTEASVWPALLSTPPSLYFSGKICPGRLKSSGFESLDARANTVFALPRADTPVVVPYFASCISYPTNMCQWLRQIWDCGHKTNIRATCAVVYAFDFWTQNSSINYELNKWTKDFSRQKNQVKLLENNCSQPLFNWSQIYPTE